MIGKSCENALAAAKAEIEITESVTVSEPIEGVIENESLYTYIQYEQGEGGAFSIKTDDGTSEYALYKSELGTFEVKDDVITEYTGEAPDFSEYLKLAFALEDVKTISVEWGDKGTKLYTVTMTDAYADKFDAESEGSKYDCKSVQYVYKIDSLTRLKFVDTKYTADVVRGDKTISSVKTVELRFAPMDIQ